MARDLDADFRKGFQEYKATATDDDGDTHESSVRAHVVSDKDFNGYEVPSLTPNGLSRVRVGDAVVETSRPGVYDVVPKSAWEQSDYGKAVNTPDSGTQTPSKAPTK